MIDYLRDYAADLDAHIRTGCCVDDVGRGPDGSVVLTAANGRHLAAGAVVAATGRFGRRARTAAQHLVRDAARGWQGRRLRHRTIGVPGSEW
jgi:predicted NAD/FAD-binding protein